MTACIAMGVHETKDAALAGPVAEATSPSCPDMDGASEDDASVDTAPRRSSRRERRTRGTADMGTNQLQVILRMMDDNKAERANNAELVRIRIEELERQRDEARNANRERQGEANKGHLRCRLHHRCRPRHKGLGRDKPQALSPTDATAEDRTSNVTLAGVMDTERTTALTSETTKGTPHVQTWCRGAPRARNATRHPATSTHPGQGTRAPAALQLPSEFAQPVPQIAKWHAG